MQNEEKYKKILAEYEDRAKVSIKEMIREIPRGFDFEEFQTHVESHCSLGLKYFKKIIRSYVFFHFFFIGLLLTEILAFSLSLTFLSKSALIAFSLAGIVLTAFAYLVILLYFQAKKPEQFIELRNWYLLQCKQTLSKNLGLTEHHLSLAHSAYRFAQHLMKKQSSLYAFLPTHQSLNGLMQKFSDLCHEKDLHKMQEMLLLASIREHIQLIKQAPTDLEAHASLANAYIALSKIYSKESKETHDKFVSATQKAIEEFKILDHYSPHDPWIQAQLASCYHDMHLFEEEIVAYEKILRLCPDDKQVLFRLGVLYFQQGKNAEGLRIYETLKGKGFSRIDELIDYYDAHIIQAYAERS